ncbi:MAG TPA: hypothetical protein VLJ57_10105 [Burkholderiaceae bacterium]|nr:hypothetical protein [Burkholderiaceae bacterium]
MQKLLRRLLLTGLVAAFVLPLVLLAVVFFMAVQDQPLIERTADITPANIERAKRILERNDPRQMKPGTLRTITVDQEDLDLAVNYAARRYAKGGADVVLRQGTANLRATLSLPPNPAGRYLNIEAEWRDTAALPQLERLRVGRLRVPKRVADWLLQRGIAYLQGGADYRAATDAIKRVNTSAGMVQVIYEWNNSLPDQLRAALVTREDQERMQAYQQRLVDFTRHAATLTHRVTVSELLQPLFMLAAQRSVDAALATTPAAENRAALVVLAFYVNGKGLDAIHPAAALWPRPAPRRVTLAGRGDTAQHFTISAALAATAGSPLSDAVGLYKEIEDSRGGSGFSFNDLAADRAGTRFGELATAGTDSAQKVQRQLAARLRDADYMPHVSDLPEFLQQADFKRRYGGVGSPAYLSMAKDIERRVAALPLYR